MGIIYTWISHLLETLKKGRFQDYFLEGLNILIMANPFVLEKQKQKNCP